MAENAEVFVRLAVFASITEALNEPNIVSPKVMEIYG
jgi:hypothetical protein